MPYARLASSVDQVIENAVRFRDLMEGSDSAAKTALIATIPYFRSWVAVLVDGEFVLAPSKWVGYVDMDPDFYVRHHHDQLDGRHTERAMAPWLRQVGTDHALWDQLHGLCARHGKRPNAACRICNFEYRAFVHRCPDPHCRVARRRLRNSSR